jgi:PAS domain S-box-containing protein
MNRSSLESENETLRQRVTELEAELSRRAALSFEDGYRYTVELNPQVTWTADAAGRVEDINQRWLDLTGLPKEQALGDGWTRAVHPEDMPAVAAAWERAVGTGDPYDVEHRMLLADGRHRWMRSRAVVRRDSRGEITRWYGTTEDISQRKEAEQLLKNTEQSFRAAFAEAPIGMVLLSADGKLLEVNRAYWQMLGYDAAHLTGKNSAGVTHPEDIEKTRQFFVLLQQDETDKAVLEKRYIHREGHTIWTRASATMRRDAQGRPMEVVAIVEDITRHKLAEMERERLLSEVEAERKRLEAVASQMPLGLLISDREGKLIFFNQEGERLLGHRLRLGSDYLDYARFGPSHQNGTPLLATEHAMGRALLKGEVIRDEEGPYRRPDGSITTLQISAAPVYDEAKNMIGTVALLGDISPRKELEKILRENEERLQLIFAQAPVGVCVLRGRDLVYELVNPHYQEILPDRDLLGRSLLDAVPEVSPGVLDILHGVLDTGQAFAATEFLIPLDQNRDGIVEDCWFNFVYHPLRDRQGDVSGVVAIAIDVSSHVRARRELQRANRELEEFAYVSSHDLQEPLRMVNIYTQLLMRDLEPVLSPSTIGFAEEVQHGVARMERLLKDLLNFSRVVAAESAPEEPESLADLNLSAREAVQTMQGRIDEAGANVSMDKLPTVHGDQTQFAQVFQNLISNALKYRKPGRPPVIEIKCCLYGSEACVAVRDNGIGFEQAQSERIFGLFKRLHKDAYPGTGLGLAICKRIVERYGGRIWAESSPDQGAAFFVAFKGVVAE